MKPLNLLHEVCALPTAPFAEGHVVKFIEQFVKQRKKLRLSRDEFGNLLIELAGKKVGKSAGKGSSRGSAKAKGTTARPRWVFTAHMDHPGLVVDSVAENGLINCRFHGGVLKEFVAGAKVRFFAGNEQITGKVVEVLADAAPREMYPSGCVVRVGAGVKLSPGKNAIASKAITATKAGMNTQATVAAKLRPGTPGMFDLTEGRIVRRKGQPARFESRVCDDLAGAAAALAMMDELHQRPPASTVAILLTPAEEEGFIGAIAASQCGTLLKKTDRLVAIEMSAEQPHAPQGKGPIIRVGDRTSIFDSAITWFIGQQAQSLSKSEKGFVSQRALMPGGTCEATAYGLYGYSAGSICLALGNYHNMDRSVGKLAAEYVQVDDWLGMVKLFVQVARHGHTFDPDMNELRGKLDRRFAKFSRYL